MVLLGTRAESIKTQKQFGVAGLASLIEQFLDNCLQVENRQLFLNILQEIFSNLLCASEKSADCNQRVLVGAGERGAGGPAVCDRRSGAAAGGRMGNQCPVHLVTSIDGQS